MVKHSMIFWNYYASVIWTETWTFWGEPCGSWWTASWTPRFPPRSALSTANAVRRRTYRNGYRNRTWDTRVSTTELNINGVAHSQGAGRQLLSQPAGTHGGAARKPRWPSSSKPMWRASLPAGWMT